VQPIAVNRGTQWLRPRDEISNSLPNLLKSRLRVLLSSCVKCYTFVTRLAYGPDQVLTSGEYNDKTSLPSKTVGLLVVGYWFIQTCV